MIWLELCSRIKNPTIDSPHNGPLIMHKFEYLEVRKVCTPMQQTDFMRYLTPYIDNCA